MTTKTEPKTYEGRELWDSFKRVPKEYVGKQTFRTKLNTWSACGSREYGTELWGPYGSAWGLRSLHYETERADGQKPARITLDAVFFWPGNDEGFEVSHCWEWRPNQHNRAMLQTCCLKKGMSYLGIAKELYTDDDDDAQRPKQSDKEMKAQALGYVPKAKDTDYLDRLTTWARDCKLSANDMADVMAAVDAKRSELEMEGVFGGEDKAGQETGSPKETP